MSVEFGNKIEMIGTIGTINTFASKGGGLSLGIETENVAIFPDLVSAKTNVCKILIEKYFVNTKNGDIIGGILNSTDFNGTIKSPALKRNNGVVEFKVESSNDAVAGKLPVTIKNGYDIVFDKITIMVSSTRITSSETDIEEDPELEFEGDETEDIEIIEDDENNSSAQAPASEQEEEYEEFEIEEGEEEEEEYDVEDDEIYEEEDDS